MLLPLGEWIGESGKSGEGGNSAKATGVLGMVVLYRCHVNLGGLDCLRTRFFYSADIEWYDESGLRERKQLKERLISFYKMFLATNSIGRAKKLI